MKIGKRRAGLLILGMGVVAGSILLVMATRRPPSVVEFTNDSGMKIKGIAISCDGKAAQPRELADGESAWFKIDDPKSKDARILYLDVGGRGESLSLTDHLSTTDGPVDAIHVSVNPGRSVAMMSGLRFSDRWTDFRHQGRIWFHRNF